VTLQVRLLGHPRIEGGTRQPCQPPRGQKSWALLARLVLAERPLTRSELAAELFGEADDPLGALRWCLADLRRCCQNPQLFRGDPVSLADGCLWVDVRALWDGSLPAAGIGGTLLEGVEPRNCPAFGVWLMLARGRCAARSMEELRRAALGLLSAGDAEAAIEPAGRAAALDLLDEGVQELFLRTLVAAGHPARAPSLPASLTPNSKPAPLRSKIRAPDPGTGGYPPARRRTRRASYRRYSDPPVTSGLDLAEPNPFEPPRSGGSGAGHVLMACLEGDDVR